MIYNTLLIVCRRGVLPPRSLLFLSNNTGLCYTKDALCLQCLLNYHHIVYVVLIFQFHMHLVALTVPFPPSDIITFMILLLHLCLKFVMMLRLNLFFNHLQVRLLDTKLLFVKMMPALISMLLFGVLDINQHFLTSVCLIPWPLLTGLQHLVLPTASMSRRSAVHMRKG